LGRIKFLKSGCHRKDGKNKKSSCPKSFYDKNDRAKGFTTTNWFELLDIELAAGDNELKITAVDRAGNISMRTVTFRLELAGMNSPPAVTLTYPPNGAVLAGDFLTIAADVDDVSAKASVTVLDADWMVQQVISGLVIP
jgi:hypothetical protein